MGLGLASGTFGSIDATFQIVAKQNELQPTPTTKELASPHGELTANLSVTESTTHKLDLPMK